MQKKIRLKIVIVLVFSILCSVFTYIYLDDLKEEVKIYVLMEEVEARTPLKLTMVRQEAITYKDQIRFFSKAVLKAEDVEKLVSLELVPKGTIIQNDGKQFSYVSASNGLREDGTLKDSEFIPIDSRVAVVNIPLKGAIVDKLHRDDYVDLVYTQKEDVGMGGIAALVLQHIRVYDVSILEDETANIYLVVTPEQALTLSLSKNIGHIDLTLNPLSGTNKEVMPLSVQDMIGYILEPVKTEEATGGK